MDNYNINYNLKKGNRLKKWETNYANQTLLIILQ